MLMYVYVCLYLSFRWSNPTQYRIIRELGILYVHTRMYTYYIYICYTTLIVLQRNYDIFIILIANPTIESDKPFD